MVICGIVLESGEFEDLRKEGIRDSKEINPHRREELKVFLEERAEVIEIVEFEPWEIDELRREGTNLNRIEAIGFARILDRLSPEKAYLDSASANPDKFTGSVRDLMDCSTELIVEHEADKNHVPVSAASIVAKVRRDMRIDELKEKYGETGSGYPSDGKTIKFLKDWMESHKSLPNFARETWKTAQRIKSEFES